MASQEPLTKLISNFRCALKATNERHNHQDLDSLDPGSGFPQRWPKKSDYALSICAQINFAASRTV